MNEEPENLPAHRDERGRFQIPEPDRSALDLLDLPWTMPGDVVPQESTFLATYSPEGAYVTDDLTEGAMYWARMRKDDANHFVTDLAWRNHLFWVSTVFLSHNHNSWDGPPLVWETMIQGDGEWSDWQYRYCTKAAALNGHLTIVRAMLSVGLTIASSNVEITPAIES